jgi:hypothetical protein
MQIATIACAYALFGDAATASQATPSLSCFGYAAAATCEVAMMI